VELIYTRLYEALKKLGLEPMETVGQTFDPNLHQAVEKVETDQAADQSILGEFQKGYTFKGKLLRPAMVRVAVRPS
jgi:molecular chaperone GrpE